MCLVSTSTVYVIWSDRHAAESVEQRPKIRNLIFPSEKQRDFNVILCHTSFNMSATKNLESRAHAIRFLLPFKY